MENGLYSIEAIIWYFLAISPAQRPRQTPQTPFDTDMFPSWYENDVFSILDSQVKCVFSRLKPVCIFKSEWCHDGGLNKRVFENLGQLQVFAIEHMVDHDHTHIHIHAMKHIFGIIENKYWCQYLRSIEPQPQGNILCYIKTIKTLIAHNIYDINVFHHIRLFVIKFLCYCPPYSSHLNTFQFQNALLRSCFASNRKKSTWS